MKYALIVFGLCFGLSGCAAHRLGVPEQRQSYVHEQLPFAVSEAMAKDAMARLAVLYPPGRTALYLQKPVLSPEQVKRARERLAGEKAARLVQAQTPVSAPAKGRKGKGSKSQSGQPAESPIAQLAVPEPRLFIDAFESELRQAGFRIVSAADGESPRVSWTIDRLATEPHEPEFWYLRLQVADRQVRRIVSRVYDGRGVARAGFAEGRME